MSIHSPLEYSGPYLSILSDHQSQDLDNLATIVNHSYTRSRRYEFSMITDAHYATVYSDIIAPVAKLNVSSAYTLQRFLDYSYHHCDRVKRVASLLYHFRHDDPSKFEHTFNQSKLGCHLVSVDLWMERIAPNEDTRLLVAKAVAKFNKERSRERPEKRIERKWWVDDAASIALAEEVVEVAKARTRADGAA